MLSVSQDLWLPETRDQSSVWSSSNGSLGKQDKHQKLQQDSTEVVTAKNQGELKTKGFGCKKKKKKKVFAL